ncbi:hypothetical protein U9M48_004586, partial [Paspalum notatum var. saurae]
WRAVRLRGGALFRCGQICLLAIASSGRLSSSPSPPPRPPPPLRPTAIARVGISAKETWTLMPPPSRTSAPTPASSALCSTESRKRWWYK